MPGLICRDSAAPTRRGWYAELPHGRRPLPLPRLAPPRPPHRCRPSPLATSAGATPPRRSSAVAAAAAVLLLLLLLLLLHPHQLLLRLTRRSSRLHLAASRAAHRHAKGARWVHHRCRRGAKALRRLVHGRLVAACASAPAHVGGRLALRRLAAQRGSSESWGGGEGILRASAQPGAQLGHLERVVDAES